MHEPVEYQWAQDRATVAFKKEFPDEAIQRCSRVLKGTVVPRTMGTVIDVDEQPAKGVSVLVQFPDGSEAWINPELLNRV